MPPVITRAPPAVAWAMRVSTFSRASLSTLDYVQAAETLFITASPEDVAELQAVAADVGARIRAMNKMAESLSFDCATCAYRPVCADVAELRAMRRKQESREPSRRLHS